MQSYQQWIWENPGWPQFEYDMVLLLPRLTVLSRRIGALEAVCRTLEAAALLDVQAEALASDAMETSAIEGEILRQSSVRASVRKRLGLPVDQDDSDVRSDALAAMLLDARDSAANPLTEEQLFGWQAAIFPTGYSGLHKVRAGCYRGDEPMLIVSGPLGREKIHYVAPPARQLAQDMRELLIWLNDTSANRDPIITAGIAHLWFIMIHPFDDGNGRVARAVTDFMLARDFPLLPRVVSFSRQVSLDRKGYYSVLEAAGKGGLDITEWLAWFLSALTAAVDASNWIIEQVAAKARFWEKHRDALLNARQRKAINRLLDLGDRFEGGMTTRKFAGMTKCSPVTASRDLAELEQKGLLRKRPGRGRSTSYELVMPDHRAR